MVSMLIGKGHYLSFLINLNENFHRCTCYKKTETVLCYLIQFLFHRPTVWHKIKIREMCRDGLSMTGKDLYLLYYEYLKTHITHNYLEIDANGSYYYYLNFVE